MTEPETKASESSDDVQAFWTVTLHVHVHDCSTGSPIQYASVDPDPRGGNGSDPNYEETDQYGIAQFTLTISGSSETYDIPIYHSNYYSKYPRERFGSGGTYHVFYCLDPKP